MQSVLKIGGGLLLRLRRLRSEIWAFEKFENKKKDKQRKDKLIFDFL